jgi:LuxR family maltose regulon positive regulatory protein
MARELAKESEGWITGILLTTHTLWNGLIRSIIRTKRAESLYEYLANEVFIIQSEEVQRFLTASSILREMNPPLCDELLGISGSRQILKLLEERNLFIVRLEKGEEMWYRYHHLFRNFLQAKLREERPEAIITLHSKAASIFERRGEYDESIHHYLKAKAYHDAARVVNRIAKQTFDSGKLETLARWIDAFPEDVLEEHPRLLRFRAKICSEMGELEKAIELFDRACVEFLKRNDEIGVALTLVQKGVALRLQSKFKEAIESCEQALALLEDREDVLLTIAEAHRNIGICQAQLGNLPEGVAELRKSLQLHEKSGNLFNIACAHRDLGTTLRLTGDLEGSGVHFEKALRIWERFGNPGPISNLLNNIGVGYYYRGEYAKALEVYQEALAKAREAAYQRMEAFIQAGIGDVYYDLGRFEEAMEAYREGLRLAEEAQEEFLASYLLNAMGNVHRLRGDYAKALEFIRRAYQRAREQGSDYHIALFETSLGVISYEQGKAQRALEHLNSARQIFSQCGATIELAKVNFHLANLFYGQGKAQKALESLEEMLDCTFSLGYDQFLVPLARRALPLIRYAVEKGANGERLESLLSRAEREEERILPPVERIRAPAKARPPLIIYAFGEARVLRGDRIISDSE